MSRQQLSAGDCFQISVGAQWTAMGQVLEVMPQALNSVGVALWLPQRNGINSDSVPPNTPFSILLITPELLKQGIWRIVRSAKICVPTHVRPYEAFRAAHWVGAKIIGAGIVEEFLQAAVGLRPWDDWANPQYLDSLLAPGQRRPITAVLKNAS